MSDEKKGAVPTGEEEWRPIPGFHGYDVSSLGRVRSWWREYDAPYVLTLRPRGFGYLGICLRQGGLKRYPAVHRLALLAFSGPPPAGHEGCHLDGDRHNNAITNLRWATHRENLSHRVEHGSAPIGSRNATSKLTESAVAEMRAEAANGVAPKDLARRYGVSWSNTRKILAGCSWRHVPRQGSEPTIATFRKGAE